ncbi:hypothetical protein [Limnohabitans sp.]|jgi:hypothetical protein
MSKKWFLWLFLAIQLIVNHNTVLSDSTVLVQGRVVPGGIVCPLFRSTAGEVLSLTGLNVMTTAPQALLTLRGRWEAQSVCMQGYPTLRVEHLLISEVQ